MIRNTSVLALISTGLILFPDVGQCGLTQVNDISALQSGDSIFVTADAPGTLYNDYIVYPTSGNVLTWSRPSSTFEIDQAGVNYSGTAFPDGTAIVFAGGFNGSTGDGSAVTLTFAQPVTQFGMNVEEFDLGSYSISFAIFSGNNWLGSYMALGDDPNQLGFAGASSSDFGITKVVFDDSPEHGNNIGFGPVTYRNSASQSVELTDTPEPVSLLLTAIAILSLSWYRSRLVS